jgi:isopentenyl diphosphate isomerase/L-lactate dehydrogenase-like FMN-dependent dehydrogenase
MAKKIGTIKITRKITVKRQIRTNVHTEQAFRSEPVYTPIPQQSTAPQQALNAATQAAKQLESTIKKAARSAKLPTGRYTPQVETVYEELYKRSKTGDEEAAAMYDVFISHASEDKADFVQPLVEALQNVGVRVWYDALDMQWGKGLREQIDNGIKRSKYAILVFSKNFFSKKWPKRELDGILAKEEITGATPLPIWYNISYEEVYEFSPTLSGLYSLSTDKYSIPDICKAFGLILNKENASA